VSCYARLNEGLLFGEKLPEQQLFTMKRLFVFLNSRIFQASGTEAFVSFPDRECQRNSAHATCAPCEQGSRSDRIETTYSFLVFDSASQRGVCHRAINENGSHKGWNPSESLTGRTI
jgi:hypothetical protein